MTIGNILASDWVEEFPSWEAYCEHLGVIRENEVDVAVCMPYFSSGCEWREKAFEFCRNWWADEVGVPLYVSERATTRSAARNELAAATDAEVLFFVDADTFLPAGQFWAAAALAAQHRRLIFAYDIHCKLSAEASRRVYNAGKLPAKLVARRIPNMPLGAVAVSRSLFDAVGGFDERFQSWGGEDRAFQYACETLFGLGERVAGDSHHLWHPVSPDARPNSLQRRSTISLAMRYKALAGRAGSANALGPVVNAKVDPEGMKNLLNEPGGPLRPNPTPPGFAVVGTGRSGTGFVASLLQAHGLDVGHEAWWTPKLRERDALDGDVSWMAVPDIELGTWEGPVVHVVRHPVKVVSSLLGISFFSRQQARANPYSAFAVRAEPKLERLSQPKAAVEWWVAWNRRCAEIADVTVRIEDIAQQETLDRVGKVIGHKLDAGTAAATPDGVNSRRRANITPAAVWKLLDGRAEPYGYSPTSE